MVEQSVKTVEICSPKSPLESLNHAQLLKGEGNGYQKKRNWRQAIQMYGDCQVYTFPFIPRKGEEYEEVEGELTEE